MRFLPSLFLIVESWTLTLTEASEACSSLVMWRSTQRLRSFYQKTKHLTLKHCIGAWFVLPKACDLWRPKLHSLENHVTASVSASNEAKHSAVSFILYYIIMRLHGFIFILIYILRSNVLCPWNNSLKTETELTFTDHRCNPRVLVCLIYLNYFSGSTLSQMNDFDNGHYFYTIN